jgi:hypothetical protein
MNKFVKRKEQPPSGPEQRASRRNVVVAAVAALAAVGLLIYMLGPAGPVGPPYRDENITAGPPALMLVLQPAVCTELALSAAQVGQLEEVVKKQFAGMGMGAGPGKGPPDLTAPRSARMGPKHQEAFLANVLQPAQIQRLRQIILQKQGGLALASTQTADALGLSDSQRARARTLVDQLAMQLDPFRAAPGPHGWREMQGQRDAAAAKLLALLTPEQLERWNQMIGAPFAGEIRVGPPMDGPPPGFPKGALPPGFPKGALPPGFPKDSPLPAP